jgi:putative tricarboxylic transport membrane protein
VNWRGLYTPKGASESSYKKWTEALRKVGASKEWKDAMMANGLAPFNKVGPDFQSYVDGTISEVRAMSTELGVMK